MAMRRSAPASATGGALTRTERVSLCDAVPVVESSVTVSVTNKGKLPIYRLRAITKSDNHSYDERELVFGRVDPGQTREATTPLGPCVVPEKRADEATSASVKSGKEERECRVPMDSSTREDVVRIKFSAEGGEPPPDAEIRPTVEELPRPTFAYTYQIVDNRPGNGDGQVKRGEGVSIYLDVRNVGRGRSYETQALLRNLTGDGLLLRAGRFDISDMEPGESRQVVFTFDALPILRDDEAQVEISVVDHDLRVVSNEKITIPVVEAELSIAAADSWVLVNQDTPVRGQPSAEALAVGTLAKGSLVKQTGSVDAYARVELEQRARLRDQRGVAARFALQPRLALTRLDLESPLEERPHPRPLDPARHAPEASTAPWRGGLSG